MAKIRSFEEFSDEYDQWFIKNKDIYEMELDAVKDFIPMNSFGCEIGIGTGKFAGPLKIKTGIDPSFKMASKAKALGINVSVAVAESLPFKDKTFDYAAVITSICFFDDVDIALTEIYRILKNRGIIIIGFIDSKSDIGKEYVNKKDSSKFYKDATFYSTDEIFFFLKKAGFNGFNFNQTIFKDEKSLSHKFTKGYGEGSFVVVRGVKN